MVEQRLISKPFLQRIHNLSSRRAAMLCACRVSCFNGLSFVHQSDTVIFDNDLALFI